MALADAVADAEDLGPGRTAGRHRRARARARGEWTHYTADVRGSKYSPLDQISAANFGKLEVAWRFKTDNLGPRPEYNLEGTPLMVNGFVYATAGTRKAVVKLDARTGELKWMYSMDEGRRAEVAPRRLSGRGVSYWTDGKGDERIYLVTMGYRLVALNAATGQPVNSFGTNGVVDLKVGVMTGKPGHPRADADRPRRRRNRAALDTDRHGQHDHRRIVVPRGPELPPQLQLEGPGAGVRRPDGQADLALQHDARPG